MDMLWLKIIIPIVIGYFIYKEILKTATNGSTPKRSKAGFIHLTLVAFVTAALTYLGISITWIETRDLQPYKIQGSPEMVNIFDPGVFELNGMWIKTNLAPEGELSELAKSLVEGCNGSQNCEAQKLFDYVTAISYHTDHTSRDARDVIKSGWGDCDDKSNLYASLLNERKINYLLVYVPHHVFMAVQLDSTESLPFMRSSIQVNGKRYYYAETTASGARLGEFNGQFPNSFEGIYDLKNHQEIDISTVSFRLF